jgi:hypothetical protein
MDTEFNLYREEAPGKTFGKLYKGGVYLCETLEDEVRKDGEYVEDATAIPYGRYRMSITYSNRFKKQMILITNVRGSKILYHGYPIDSCGIRVHGGNDENDTEGCVLAGKTRTATGIKDCTAVNTMLIDMVRAADQVGEVYLNILKAA